MWEFIFRWETLWWVMMLLYIPSCIGLIVVVLLQKGKGVGFAGAFGVGTGSDAVFGPRASKSLPAKLTTIMASIFMILAFALSLISGRLGKGIAPEKVVETPVHGITTSLDSAGIGQGDAAAAGVEPAAQPSAPVPAAGEAAPESAGQTSTPSAN